MSMPELNKHQRVVQRLGVEGMSSDSEDDSTSIVGGRPIYYINTPPWRAPAVGHFLRILDILYDYVRQQNFGLSHVNDGGIGGRQGAFPHRRQVAQRFSKRNTVKPYLPVSAYDPGWLQRQLHPEVTICPDLADAYSFVHDDKITECVLSLLISKT